MTKHQLHNLNMLKRLLDKHGEILVRDLGKMSFFIEACQAATQPGFLNPEYYRVPITGKEVELRYGAGRFTAYDNSK